MVGSDERIKLAIEKGLNKEEIYLCGKEIKWEMQNCDSPDKVKQIDYAKICIVNHNGDNTHFSIYMNGVHYEYDAFEDIMHSIEEEFNNNVLISFQTNPLAMIVRLK